MEHPITEQIQKQVADIENARSGMKWKRENRSVWNTGDVYEFSFDGVRRWLVPPLHAQPVYVLDKELNIIARVEAKNRIVDWIEKNVGKRVTGQTAYRYFSSGQLYKGKYHFVPVHKYEEFMEAKKN
jgi:hypothetical protein